MTVKSAQLISGQFTVHSGTNALVNADALPTGTLVVAGANNGAGVTVANVSTGVYSWSVTLPTLTAGQVVQVRIAATVATVATGGVVFKEMADTKLTSDLQDPTVASIQSGLATSAAQAVIDDLVDDLETRLTATRAGYLDNLSAGAVATAAALATVDANVDAILLDTGTTLPAALAAVDAKVDVLSGGAGTSTLEVTILGAGSAPLDGAEVDVTTTTAHVNIVANGYTDAFGKVTFHLDPGTYYIWVQHAGYNGTNPTMKVVT